MPTDHTRSKCPVKAFRREIHFSIPPMSTEQAWALWSLLTDLSTAVWEQYDDVFVPICQNNTEPTDPPYDVLEDLNDVPF
jgi:hypothetical protein